jgi:hypothetical protein
MLANILHYKTMSNFTTVGPLKGSYHFYHKGVRSRPEWAYSEARRRVESNLGTFMAGLPNTAAVRCGDFVKGNLGGTIARQGEFTELPSVTGAGSDTKNRNGVRSWEAWFDLHYGVSFFFFDSAITPALPKGYSTDEVDAAIKAGTNGAIV